jgi:hypothetical protein
MERSKESNSLDGEPGRFITYSEIAFGITSGEFELKIEKYDSSYIIATIRSTETENDLAYKGIR